MLSRIIDPRLAPYNLSVETGLSDVSKDGYATVRVLNAQRKPITLGEMVPVARFDLDIADISEPDYSPEEVEKIIKIWPGLHEGDPALVAERLKFLRKLIAKNLRLFRKELGAHYTHVTKYKIDIDPNEPPYRAPPQRMRTTEE